MRVLIVDDQPTISSYIEKIFKSQSIACDIAENAEQAINQASSNDYDVILLDIVLPDQTGFEVCSILREKGVSTPIIMTSAAKTEITDKVEGLDLGADDYITKPFSAHELLARLRAASRRKSNKPTAMLKIGNLDINHNDFTIKNEDKTQQLSAREFRLLEFLAKNEGKVVSQYKILENIWGSDTMSLSNIVEVYISKLRKYFRELDATVEIRTLRGEGYILTSPQSAEKKS